ncbi:hypothetical protein JCM24511_01425 [Saitozyma sp. JCM 24511]|nr:hypothetical protein JCM24511_01425 [Saitozyma sp. JCM 24511]
MASPSHSSRATPTLPSLSHTAGPSTISSMPPSPASAPGSAAAAVLGDLKGEEGLSHLEPRVKGQGEEEIVEHLVEELKAEGESDPQVSEPRGW